jgi:regulatory protein
MGAMKERQAAPAVTMAALERAAAFYLERYASSGETLRRVLMRRVAKAARDDAVAAGEGRALVEALLARYLQAGLIDDGRYAEAKAAGLARSGASRFQIRGRLMQKGVARDEIDRAVATLDARGEGTEAAAACALMRRKRLGPYRRAADRAAFRQKDLAALARAGFALDLARRLLRAPDVEALENMARGEDA